MDAPGQAQDPITGSSTGSPALRRPGRGHTPVEVEGLVAQWHLMREGRERMRRLVASLTAREREVLELLYAGDTVAEIAEHFGVAQTTVRTQVKSILRKLEVGSQLAAVAAYDRSLHPAPSTS